MGLTIHYKLRSDCRSVNQARTIVEQLRQRALGLPFQSVGDVMEFNGDDCSPGQCKKSNPHYWLKLQGEGYIDNGDTSCSVMPKHIIAFSTLPGEGTEDADFGLALYPGLVSIGDKRIRTRLKGWSWSSFCKTQYASNPQHGGVEHFLRCHLSVVKLLDYAKDLGILGDVRDEGEFWENRDVLSLARKVGNWNTMIAGFTGQVKDGLGIGGVSEISKYPNFEHLEAKGREPSKE